MVIKPEGGKFSFDSLLAKPAIGRGKRENIMDRPARKFESFMDRVDETRKESAGRIHLMAARNAPLVALIRRGPSRYFHIMRWNTQDDTIEHGSWFKGRIWPLDCDISLDGQWMIYYARGKKAVSWNGICRLPWLKTICDGTANTHCGGGGYWKNSDTIVLNYWEIENRNGELPFSVEKEYLAGRLDGMERKIFERDGWTRDRSGWIQGDSDPGWYCKPTPLHPTLWAFHRGSFNCEPLFEFHLTGYPDLLNEHVQWATWDCLGQLIVSRSGKIERYRLEDLERGQPAFQMSFEDLRPPTQLKTPSAESGRKGEPRTSGRYLRKVYKRNSCAEMEDVEEETFSTFPPDFLETLSLVPELEEWRPCLQGLQDRGLEKAIRPLFRSLQSLNQIMLEHGDNPQIQKALKDSSSILQNLKEYLKTTTDRSEFSRFDDAGKGT